jgi:RNA polymerase subunit RPABC4/transcription elongation factor Spt4
MTRVRCANCATVFSSGEGLCPGCGLGVEAVGIEEPGLGPSLTDGPTCPECQGTVGEYDPVCPNCGADLDEEQP